jgi:hypothetical protein
MSNDLITFKLPALGTNNVPADFNFSGMTSPVGLGNPLAQALANIPKATVAGNGNLPQTLSQGPSSYDATVKTLDKYVKSGDISEAERDEALSNMRESLKASLGITPAETQNPFANLHKKELEKAITKTTGAYAITDEHSEIASQCVEGAKKILEKENPSEAELQTIEEIFNKLSKNPMLAEAFAEESNKTTLANSNGKTTTLLGRYEELLTKSQGTTIAKEKIAEIRGDFNKNLESRNPDLLTDFNTKADADSKIADKNNTETDKWMRKAAKHPIATGVAGVAVAGLATWGAVAAAPIILPALPVIAAVAGVAVIGKGIWDICNEKD